MLNKIISTRQSSLDFSYDIAKDYPFYQLPFPKKHIAKPFNAELIKILENATPSPKTSAATSGPADNVRLKQDTIITNGKRIELLWVPHIHTKPKQTKTIFRGINHFFDQVRSTPLSQNSKSVAFIETIPELGRKDKRFRKDSVSFEKLLTQILSQSPHFPGENWYAAAKAAEYGLPLFCPEPSEQDLINKTNMIQSIQPVHLIAYKFFTDHYKLSKQSNDPSLKFGSLDTVLKSYIQRYAGAVNEEGLKTAIDHIIDQLWGGMFDFNARFFKNHSQDFETLMTPTGFSPSSIEGPTISDGLTSAETEELVHSIRNVPHHQGLCRDLNILHELHSALHSNDVIYMVYGYGHRQTLLPGIRYLLSHFKKI